MNINTQKRWTVSITDGQEGIRHKLVTGLITIHKYIRHDDTLPWSTRTAIHKLCFHKHLQFPLQSRFIINILRLVFLLMASTWCQAQVNRKTTCKEWKSWRKYRRHSGWMLQQSTMDTEEERGGCNPKENFTAIKHDVLYLRNECRNSPNSS